MKKILFLISISCLSSCVFAQNNQVLRLEIQKILAGKNLTAGISIKNLKTNDTLSFNRNEQVPMLSVFKFHIALTALDLVDKKKLNLNDKIFIKKADLHPNTWSPLKDDYPEGNVNITLDQLLSYTVSHSDNNGCDILLDLIGGTTTVQKFIVSKGIKDFTIEYNEQQMNTFERFYKNTTTPLATTSILEKFYKGKILKKNTTAYLYDLMVKTSRGLTWMKAGLPENTELAHRTGISSLNDENMRAALNDVGIFKLPNGQPIILTVYLKNITEERAATEKIIADIAKATYTFYSEKN